MNRPILFHGGPILTLARGSGVGPRPEAVLVVEGRIAGTGSVSELRRIASREPEPVDLAGRALLPGFVDAHTHFLTGGRKLGCVKLRDAVTPNEFVRRIGDFVAITPRGEWITGGDWDHELWGGELPTRDWIDHLTRDHPIWLHRLDIHMTLANGVALAMAGIDDETPDPAGGEIVRDAEGRATGILKDAAMELVGRLRPEPDDSRVEGWLRTAARHALANGVTQIHDVDGWDSLDCYRRVHGRGELPLRVYAAVPMASWERLEQLVRTEGRGDERLWWGGLKAFVDGSLGSRTAWFHEPYLGDSGETGLVVCDLDELRARMIAADAVGLQTIVHAIGDRANDWVLDACEAVMRTNPPRDRRPRIEHAQHLTREAIPRFGALGVIPSVQPAHAIDDAPWAVQRIGEERIRTTYAFASLVKTGARLAFGSDWTVAALDPMRTVAAAVTRVAPGHPEGWNVGEAVDVETALRAHTLGAAHAGFSDGFSGSIEVGKRADLVVVDADPVEVPETDLVSIFVQSTWVDGVEVYARESDSRGSTK